MGAQLWFHEAAWYPDADAALKSLQADFLAEHYDLSALLPRELANARQSVAAAKNEDDPYGLVDLYQRNVDMLEDLSGQPIPDDVMLRIDILRRINAATGSEIGNVLDVTRISSHRSLHTAQLLGDEAINRLFGVTRPSREQARHAIDKINEELGRAEAICFPVYENGVPVGWYFVGNTAD
jgi:hypothetical protein